MRKAARRGKPRGGNPDWLAHVTVGFKPEVLDPQGKTVLGALASLGFKRVREVRVGKHFWIRMAGSLSRAAAEREAKRMAGKVLVNPVIETFGVSLERRG